MKCWQWFQANRPAVREWFCPSQRLLPKFTSKHFACQWKVIENLPKSLDNHPHVPIYANGRRERETAFFFYMSLSFSQSKNCTNTHLNWLRSLNPVTLVQLNATSTAVFTITAEILACSLANFYHQIIRGRTWICKLCDASTRADNLTICYRKNKLASVFHASVMLLTMNFFITLSK